jgi:hypothetical protein
VCVSVGNGNGVSNISSHTGFIVDFELCARDFAAALVTINSLCVLTMLDWVEAVAMATSASPVAADERRMFDGVIGVVKCWWGVEVSEKVRMNPMGEL